MIRPIVRSRSLVSLMPRALRWHLRYYVRGRGFPISAACFVTNRCNLRCRMCNVWKSEPKTAIDAGHYRDMVDALGSVGAFYFSLTGGEPFLLPDVFSRLAYARERLPYVHTISNAWAFGEAAARELASTGIDEISFSLDGEERFHDRLRGVAGSYQRTMAAVELVKTHAPRVKIVVNTLVGPDNARQIPGLVRSLEKMRVWMKVQPVSIHPSFGNEPDAPDRLGSGGGGAWIQPLVEALKRSRIVVNSRFFLSILGDYFSGKKLPAGGRCYLPFFHLEYMWNGRMYPCLGGTGWGGGFEPGPDIVGTWKGLPYAGEQERLAGCRRCERKLQICYWEPRIAFPLHRFIGYNLRSLMPQGCRGRI